MTFNENIKNIKQNQRTEGMKEGGEKESETAREKQPMRARVPLHQTKEVKTKQRLQRSWQDAGGGFKVSSCREGTTGPNGHVEGRPGGWAAG